MLGSAVFRTGVAPGGALAGPWVKNELWNKARSVPSLDLRFAENKSLVDATTGQNLVTFTRASSGTYVDSQGVIRTATTNLLLRSEEFGDASWTKLSSVSVSANTVIAPNGTLTADTITADGGLGIYQTITSVIGVNYSNSIYVKAGTATSIMFRDDTGAGRHIVFNPSTGVITSTSGTLVSFGSQAVGDGWYRYWMVYAADTTSVRGNVRPNSAGSAQTFVVWGAQLEASSAVGEYIPTTSTINSAPRFDHNPTTGESLGLLVEEQRTNLLLQSEAFDTASWNKVVGGTGSTPVVNTNTATSPDGTTTADQLVLALNGGTTTSDSSYITQSYSSTSGTTYTVSAWMRTITGNVTISFDLDSSNTNTVTVTPVWQRFTFTRTSSTTGSRTVRIGLRGTFGVSDSATFYVWGAQLEAGSFPTSYIPTTTATVTRSADVASITGSNFGVSRTNLLLRSEEFNDASWNNTNATASTNVIVAPNGTLTADLLLADATTTASARNLRQNANGTVANTHTFSVYAKAKDGNFLGMTFRNQAAAVNFCSAEFNLSNGTVSIAGTNGGNATGALASITGIGNGWYRCSLSGIADTSGTQFTVILIGRTSSNNNSVIADTELVYLWGAQLETGTTATAYIPTTTAAVTVVESSWYRQDEGTVFSEYRRLVNASGRIFTFNDTTANEQIRISASQSTNIRPDWQVIDGGSVQANVLGAAEITANSTGKSAGAYKVNDFQQATNSFLGTADTTGTLPTISVLNIGANESGSGSIINGTIRRLTYWPTRLPNETLQGITQ